MPNSSEESGMQPPTDDQEDYGESNVSKALGLFTEATDTFLAAISDRARVPGFHETGFSEEVAHRADTMFSAVAMLAGVLYDDEPSAASRELAGALFGNGVVQANRCVEMLGVESMEHDSLQAVQERIERLFREYIEIAAHERDALQQAASHCLFSGTFTWMRTLNKYAE